VPPKHKHSECDTSFTKRVTDGGVDFGKKHWVTGVISLVLSSIIPIVTQWHSDKVVSDAIDASEKRQADALKAQREDFQHQLDAQKADFQRSAEKLWTVISSKKDK